QAAPGAAAVTPAVSWCQRLLEHRQGSGRQMGDLVVVQYVGRHDIDGIADGPKQQFMLQPQGEETACKACVAFVKHGIESPDHATMAKMPDARMGRQRLQRPRYLASQR